MIPFTSQLQNIKNIEIRNKAFDTLSDEDKRKEIAYDSLCLILDGKITGSNHTYWSHELYSIKHNSYDPKDFQEKLQDIPECQVYARGAVMLSQIRLNNTIHLHNSGISKGNSKNLNGFHISSMISMENQYEGNMYNNIYPIRSTQNLVNIMCNVINNGNFSVHDEKDYLKLWDIKI